MSTIPTSVTQAQFEHYIRPALRTAKRGYESKIPLFKVFNYVLYHLHTGCQWHQLPVQFVGEQKEISWQAIYYHFRKWSGDGSLERVFQHSIVSIRAQIDTHQLNLDGSHALAKKVATRWRIKGVKKPKPRMCCPSPMPTVSSWRRQA